MPRHSRRSEQLKHARFSKFTKNDRTSSLSDALADLKLSFGDHTDTEDEIMEIEETSDISDDEDDYCAALEGLKALQTTYRDSSRGLEILRSSALFSSDGRPTIYSGNSDRTRRRRKQQLREAAEGSRSILDFFATARTKVSILPLETCLILIADLPFMAKWKKKANFDC
jgi:hypothetical protein